ncbi:acVLRF1 family peptidyl-tRNA hydrolase [Aestuariimicrobium sp. Y1814]|uniref:acVLRF1 family peptidyl-tRNA hydrolase n=1 Tax=Aestuariimicrobium sp. Y1814 TaxID=3418742 RepID=UPI003DA72147
MNGSPGSPTAESPEWVKRVSVSPERLSGWVDRFRQGHGPTTWVVAPRTVLLTATDGAHALLHNPWEPLAEDASPGAVVRHLTRDRRIGLLLGRKSAHAVGIAEGGELVASKVDTSYVQGRTKAGGWSQQRYARRRGNQADKAVEATVERCLTRLLPEVGSLEGLVCGGDAAFVAAVLDDARLAPLAALRTAHPVLPVPDPRLDVLKDAVGLARAITIDLDDQAIRGRAAR